MTEQELIDGIQQVGFSSASEWTANVVSIAKAYADARVAQECKVLDETVTLLHQTIANRNVEIAELKAESKYWNERWEAGNKLQDAAFNSEIENYHEVKRLNAEIAELKTALEDKSLEYLGLEDFNRHLQAEIKRLRDGIKKGFEKLAEIPYCSVLRTIFDNAKGVQNDLESLLSPAPVTETQNEEQL